MLGTEFLPFTWKTFKENTAMETEVSTTNNLTAKVQIFLHFGGSFSCYLVSISRGHSSYKLLFDSDLLIYSNDFSNLIPLAANFNLQTTDKNFCFLIANISGYVGHALLTLVLIFEQVPTVAARDNKLTS